MAKSDFPLYLLLGAVSCVCVGAGIAAMISYAPTSKETTVTTPPTSTSSSKKEESAETEGEVLEQEENTVENEVKDLIQVIQ